MFDMFDPPIRERQRQALVAAVDKMWGDSWGLVGEERRKAVEDCVDGLLRMVGQLNEQKPRKS